MVAGVELNIDDSATAIQMAETMFGDGVQVLTASYTGDPDSSGIYTDGLTTSPGVVPSDTGVMFSTGDLRGFTNNNPFQSNLSTGRTTNSSGPNNDSDFNTQAGTNTFDASFIEATFIPDGDTMTMQIVFTSEEYPEFTGSVYQDFVGVWVNGEYVEIQVGDGDVDPGNLNGANNENLFKDNTGDAYNTEMDGVTVTLTLKMDVNPGQVNSIKIGIADVSDSSFDSTLLIAADSVQTTLIASDDRVKLDPNETKTIDVTGNDTTPSGTTLTITHVNDVAVVAGRYRDPVHGPGDPGQWRRHPDRHRRW